MDIIHSPYYIHGLWSDGNIFAVLSTPLLFFWLRPRRCVTLLWALHIVIKLQFCFDFFTLTLQQCSANVLHVPVITNWVVTVRYCVIETGYIWKQFTKSLSDLPGVPIGPRTPRGPCNPGGPRCADKPGAPRAPAKPGDPGKPVDPGLPGEPILPVQPVAPGAPGRPLGPDKRTVKQ